MKMIFYTLFVISVLETIENTNAWPWGKKDENSAGLSKTDSELNSLSSALASTSTKIEKFTQKNWKGENDVSIAFALRPFTKNASEFFEWTHILTSALKTGYDKMKSAQTALDKAKNEKATTKAENDLDAAKTDTNRAIATILGNGILAIRANTKTSATILLQLIKQTDFSQADLSELKSEFSAIKKKGDEVSVDTRSFLDTFRNIKEVGGDDVELDEKKLNELTDDINAFLDILSQLSNYFNKEGLPEDVIAGLLKKCSVASNSQQKTTESTSTKGKSSTSSSDSKDDKNDNSSRDESKQRKKDSQSGDND